MSDFMESFSYGKTMTPLQVVVVANAAAIALVCLAFLIPGTAGEEAKNRHWYRFKKIILDVGNQALYLIPALSALVLPEVKFSSYLMAGAGVWLLGVGIGATVDDLCADFNYATGDCSSLQLATHNLGNALQSAGTSLGVGALLAYVRDMGKLE